MGNIEYAGFLYDDAGDAVNGATVNLYTRNTTTPVRATTTTNSSGYFSISHATDGQYDIEIVNGSSKRRIKYDNAWQMEELETSNLLIRNPGNDYKYDIVPAAIAGDRQLNLPLITGSDTLVSLALAQTLTSKTLTAPTIADYTNAGHDHGDTDDGGAVVSASVTVSGIVEIATAAETTTGTDAARAVSPDGLAGSDVMGGRGIQVVIVDFTVDVATGNGQFYFHVDERLAGMNIVDVHAEVITAGTTNTTDIQLHNLTAAADILSTKLTIDSGETGSDTAATAAVINASEDDLTLHDIIRFDVDAVSSTAPKGLIVTIGCRLP